MAMSKRKAPEKWGRQALSVWSTDPTSKFYKNREEAFEVPEKLGIHLTPELEKKYCAVVGHFQFEFAQDFKLTTPELRALMENLRDSAEAFARSLDGIRHPALKRGLDLPPMQTADSSIKELMKLVLTWKNAAQQAMPEDGKTGPKRNQALAAFIKNLAEIYEEATGKKATPGYWDRDAKTIDGKFSRFVDAVLNKIGEGVYQSPRALIETHITKALSERSRK